jgi:Na+/H+ antiporter NhaD/arsenite permease-like protein
MQFLAAQLAQFTPLLAASTEPTPKNGFQAAAAIVIFLVCYALIAAEKFNKIGIVLVGSAAMAILGITTSSAAFFNHDTGIDWNVIFLLLGMMIIVGVLHTTGVFEALALWVIKVANGKTRRVFVYMLAFVGFASAFLDNVTAILLAVPMSLQIAKRMKTSPVPLIIGQVILSNIGGAATLIGDPPNIIIASRAGLSFNDFLIHMAPGAIVASWAVIGLLVWMSRKELKGGVNPAELADIAPASAIKDRSLLTKSLIVLGLVLTAFVAHAWLPLEPSVVALIGAGALILFAKVPVKHWAKDIEWKTLVFFAGLFIMVGGLVQVGAIAAISTWLQDTFGGNLANLALVVMVGSTIVSGIVDNIPYVTSMSPVISDLVANASTDASGLWWALAFGADFGGNMTIIGASANVVAVGLAAAAGHKIGFWQFAKYGIPATVLSMAVVIPYVMLRYFA